MCPTRFASNGSALKAFGWRGQVPPAARCCARARAACQSPGRGHADAHLLPAARGGVRCYPRLQGGYGCLSTHLAKFADSYAAWLRDFEHQRTENEETFFAHEFSSIGGRSRRFLASSRFTALARLEENRAASALARLAGAPLHTVENVHIWGCQSARRAYEDVVNNGSQGDNTVTFKEAGQRSTDGWVVKDFSGGYLFWGKSFLLDS